MESVRLAIFLMFIPIKGARVALRSWTTRGHQLGVGSIRGRSDYRFTYAWLHCCRWAQQMIDSFGHGPCCDRHVVLRLEIWWWALIMVYNNALRWAECFHRQDIDMTWKWNGDLRQERQPTGQWPGISRLSLKEEPGTGQYSLEAGSQSYGRELDATGKELELTFLFMISPTTHMKGYHVSDAVGKF